MRKLMACVILAMTVTATRAQNPIIRGQFAADPTARVFNNKVYLYPSHDIHAPEGVRQDWFCMADYHVFSSENLVDWQDHGVIIDQKDVPWGKPDAYSMWAPDCVFKGGRYYFYFPNAPREGRGFGIGVATADKPEGPFTLEPEPIKGVMGIDPCVLIDDDGQSYIYWGGMGLRGARLADNMKELAEAPLSSGAPGGKAMEGLPEGFKEGPFVFKREGHYYLTFPWVRKENGTETLAYAMSDNPLGPWDFKGIIMAEHANACWTNHHSILEYKGQWYLFYHHNDYSPNMDKRRSPCIDKIAFNADGTIQEVFPTRRGVGVNKAVSRIDVDRYNEAAEGTTTEFVDSLLPFQGWAVQLAGKNGWLRYADVDFDGLGAQAYVVANVKAPRNTTLLVREGSKKGKVLARLSLQVIGEGQYRRDYRNRWMTITSPLQNVPKGITDLYLEAGDSVCIDWLQFKNQPHYFSPVAKGTPAARPDEDGFMRRWLVLEPIPQDIRSNTVFTDSYLTELFSRAPFPMGERFVLPSDGQRLKVGRQTLRWHGMDSQFYNLKLFRFAEQFSQRVYGVLFWTITVIDCPEEISNVRLAAGSNGASMWWLNGEQSLLLSGDRRMVKDDGMSARLTLRKGRNVLVGAVVNGPGMSDMCVRFLDEQGKPVTNYTLTIEK